MYPIGKDLLNWFWIIKHHKSKVRKLSSTVDTQLHNIPITCKRICKFFDHTLDCSMGTGMYFWKQTPNPPSRKLWSATYFGRILLVLPCPHHEGGSQQRADDCLDTSQFVGFPCLPAHLPALKFKTEKYIIYDFHAWFSTVWKSSTIFTIDKVYNT